ncbi:MAG: hypothetical protein WCO79_01565 [bacterium]
MKLIFQYNKEKDIWCILNKGKSSNNSPIPTKVYEELVATCGENPSADSTSSFVNKYFLDKNIKVNEYIEKYQRDWYSITEKYQKRAESVFGVSLPSDIVVYLTINNRCPYNIEDNYFFVTIPASSVRRTIMHELWHFYMWYGLGADQEEKLGKQKYNDLKEALTVLLNVECKDLLPEGVYDGGYPQHKEVREEILEYWSKNKNIKDLWKYLQTK